MYIYIYLDTTGSWLLTYIPVFFLIQNVMALTGYFYYKTVLYFTDIPLYVLLFTSISHHYEDDFPLAYSNNSLILTPTVIIIINSELPLT